MSNRIEANIYHVREAKRTLEKALKECDRNSFGTAFDWAQTALNLSDNDLAKVIQISRPTVGRWVRGETAPHQLGRKSVLQYLLNLVNEKIESMELQEQSEP